MKPTEKLKKKFLDTIRGQASGEPFYISEAELIIDLTDDLPSEYEGCTSEFVIQELATVNGLIEVRGVPHIHIGDGQYEQGEKQETFGEEELEGQTVEFIEALAEAVEDAFRLRCEQKGWTFHPARY